MARALAAFAACLAFAPVAQAAHRHHHHYVTRSNVRHDSNVLDTVAKFADELNVPNF